MDRDSSVYRPDLHSIWSRALIFSSSVEEYSELRDAWVIFSGCLWWKYVTSEDEDDPESLLSFRGGHGIILHRLEPSSNWACVERTIRCENTEYGTAVIVPGRLVGGKQRNRTVEIAFLFHDAPLRDNFVISLRIRIAPWQLLHRRIMKWHSTYCHSPAVLKYVRDVRDRGSFDAYCCGLVAYSCLPLEESFVKHRRHLSYDEMTAEEVCELEGVVSIEKSIYVVGPSCEWFAYCMNIKFSEMRSLVRPNIFPFLEPDSGIDGIALRDFFEAQEEAMTVLENMEVMFMQSRKMTLSGIWQERVSYTLDRLHIVFEALLYSNDFVERFNTSRSAKEPTGQYSCVVRELNTLVEYDDETDESDLNEQRLLLECVGTMRRFLSEGEPYSIDVDILRELADTYHRENDMDVTGDLYQTCLDTTRRLLGNEHVSERLLEILMELAEFYVACEARWKAIDYYRESLSVSRKLYGENLDRMETASILFEIGDLLRKEEDYVKAKVHLLECYEMRQRLNGDVDDWTVVTGLVVLADVLFEEGSLSDAELRYRESLDLWEGVHGVGVDDDEVAYALQKLAEVMEKKGEFDEALLIFNECLLMRKRLFNEDDESIAEVLFSLGRLRAEIGDLDEAEVLCQECVHIMRRIHQDHWSRPKYVLALHELAKIHRRKGDLLEASRVHREVFNLFYRSMDNGIMYSRIEEDVWCSSFSTKRLSLHVVFTESEDETEEALRDALSIHQNGNGKCHHPNVVLAMYQLGGFLLGKTTGSDVPRGEEMIRESFSMMKQMNDDYRDHWLVSEDRWFEVCTLLNMGNHYLSYGRDKDAERVFRECLSIVRDVQGKEQDCLDIAECLNGISNSLPLSKSKRSEKKDILWESFEIVRRVSGDNANDFRFVVNALQDLVRFELEDGATEEVKVVVKECLNLAQRLHGEGTDHADVSRCFKFMGQVTFALQDPGSSEHWYRISWEMEERQGNPAVDYGVIYELGDLALASSRFDDAERLFRESLDGQPNEVDRAVTFQVLARSLFDAGKVEEAKRIFVDCLDAYGNTRPEYCLPPIWICSDLASRKCFDDYPFSLDFLKLRKQLLPDSYLHSGDAIALLWLARAATFAESFHNAERWSAECVRMMNQVNGDEDTPFAAFVYFALGRTAAERGSKNEAEKLYRRSLGMNRRLYGSDMNHAEHTITLYALAELLLERRKLGEAEELYRDFLEIDKKRDDFVFHDFLSSYSGDQSNAAASVHVLFNLAEAHLNEGSCSVAEKLLRECLSLARLLDIDSTKSVDLAFVLQKLACLVFEQGQLVEAKELFCESLDLFGQFDYEQILVPKEAFGMEMDTNLVVLNPSGESEEESYRISLEFHGLLSYSSGIGFIFDRLASIARKKGCCDNAGEFLCRSVAVKRHIFGKDETNYSTLLSLLWLAGVRLYEHSYDEAADLYRECREKYRIMDKNDRDHSYVGSMLIGLTRCLFERGELDQAFSLLKESEKVLEETCFPEFSLAKVRYWQSRVAYERRDMKSATDFIEQSREYYVRDSEDEIETAGFTKIVRMQACLAAEKGDLAEAGQHTWKCLTICQKLFRENAKCEELACTLGLLVRLELAKGELEDAAEYLHEAFDIRRGLHGTESDHSGIAGLLSLRAQLQFERGAKKDAVSTMEESLAMYRRVFMKTPNHRKITGVERRLLEWRREME